MTRRLHRSRWLLLAMAVAPTVLLLVFLEMSARAYFAVHHRDPSWLIVPFDHRNRAPQVAYPVLGNAAQMSYYDSCSRRRFPFRANSVGGRGDEWPLSRRRGVLRILAVGESSTFGTSSPEEATWPATLQAELATRYGIAAEVLNGGRSGASLGRHIIPMLESVWVRYEPDVVLYYGGFNEAAHPVGRRYGVIGRMTYWLYYRSMFYTYLVERAYFRRAMRSGGVPLDDFASHLREAIAIARRHGIIFGIVLQATQLPVSPAIRDLDLAPGPAIRTTVLALAEAAPATYRPASKVQIYETQVMEEAARRVATTERIPVIDPRDRFVARAGEGLFCDEIHLTDAGNRVLAEAIARDLVPVLRSSRR